MRPAHAPAIDVKKFESKKSFVDGQRTPKSVDLMARYRLTNSATLQANILNLNNAYGYDEIDNNHVVPLAGRSVLFTLTTQF